MAIPYVTDIDPAYGEVVQVTPLIRRVVCKNPGKFTFTGTGTYIVGTGSVAVIDPGPNRRKHVDAILAAIPGEEVSHIVITHTHGDHSPAAAPLQTATGAPIYGFGPHPSVDPAAEEAAKPTTWDSLLPTPEELEALRKEMAENADGDDDDHAQEEPGDTSYAPDHEIGHGDVIAGGNWTLEAIHTPGHISNHLCYGLREEQALFTGDHVMGWSTTIVPPPDGNMEDYLTSLRLLLSRDDTTYYPTHGPPIENPQAFTEALLEHRQSRENQILECLSTGPKTVPEMVTVMYTATPHILHMAAGQSVLSHLYHLTEQGRLATDGPLGADATFRLVS